MPRRRRSVFLDRDGTLVLDRGYMHRPADLRLLPYVVQGLRELQRAGLDLVLITNQSGVSRRFYTMAQMDTFHRALITRFAKANISLRGIYVCPHHPDAGCECRKPATALHMQAARELGLDTTASFSIGDRAHDVIAGKRIGCRTVLLRKSYTRREISEMDRFGIKPDFIANSFLEAARWVVRTR